SSLLCSLHPPPPTAFLTLSLHDALPICVWCVLRRVRSGHLDDQQSFFVAHLSADSYSGAQIVWADCGHRSGVDMGRVSLRGLHSRSLDLGGVLSHAAAHSACFVGSAPR